MSDDGYQGWSNYATWCVALWVDNEESTYRERVELVGEWLKEEPEFISVRAERLKAWVESMVEMPERPGIASDLLTWSLGQVDWIEILSAWEGERDE